MSDLTATNCGCSTDNGCGCNSIIWIILLLSCCGNGSSAETTPDADAVAAETTAAG